MKRKEIGEKKSDERKLWQPQSISASFVMLMFVALHLLPSVSFRHSLYFLSCFPPVVPVSPPLPSLSPVWCIVVNDRESVAGGCLQI